MYGSTTVHDVFTECSTFFHVLPQMRILDDTLFKPLFKHATLTHPHLSPSDSLKIKVAKTLCPRPSDFSRLVDLICARDLDIRKLYQEPWRIPNESQLRRQPRTLALMLALDALTLVAGACYPDTHKLLGWRDACLLENQLPLFVLEAAINVTEANKAVDQEKLTLQDVVKFYALEAAAGLFYQKPLQADDWPNNWRLDMEESMLNSIHHTIFLQGHARRADEEMAAKGESWLRRLCKNVVLIGCRSQKQEDVEACGKSSCGKMHVSKTLPYRGRLCNHVVLGRCFQKQKEDGPAEDSLHERVCTAACAGRFQEEEKDMETSGNLQDSKSHERVSTASKLRMCGIKFKAASDWGFSRIRFDKKTRILTLPKITVFDETQTYLLNLMAHEAWCSSHPVTSYIAFMDYLIDGEEDVKVLVNKKIINNQLGSHTQLASMWNQLMRFVPLNITNEDAKVIVDVNTASKDKWRRWFIEVVDTYFVNRPWLLISIIVAIFLFVLTVLQTIYTILQYHLPSNTNY